MAAKLNRRYLTIAIVGIVLLMVLAIAPTYSRIQSGSTWSSAPDGYGAWYEYMQQQGAPIERWQRSLTALVEETDANQPATLLRIVPPSMPAGLSLSEPNLYEWVEQGNQLVILGQQRPTTAAPFSSQVSSQSGTVIVATRRRANRGDYVRGDTVTSILSDAYGAVVWESGIKNYEGALAAGDTNVFQSTTPFLAANAYLSEPGNFAFLAELVQADGGPIFVDEYLHGYKDAEVVVEEVAGTWVGYLAKTPLLIVVVQSVVILLIALIAQNKRLGLVRSLRAPKTDNSAAYITALAGVLNKANSQDFLIETLTQAEQKALQRSLGLGDAPVPLTTLQTAWQQTTGHSPAELNVLKAKPRGSVALKQWLKRLQQLHTRASRSQQADSSSSQNNGSQNNGSQNNGSKTNSSKT